MVLEDGRELSCTSQGTGIVFLPTHLVSVPELSATFLTIGKDLKLTEHNGVQLFTQETVPQSIVFDVHCTSSNDCGTKIFHFIEDGSQ